LNTAQPAALMKIYTKTGDAGQTGLFSGTRIAKYDLRLHAYGTLDELNSHLGLLRDQIPAEWDAVRAELAQVQSDLFALGSHMANDLPEMVARLPHIDPAWIARLEAAIDRMDVDLEPMRNFLLPGGHVLVSQCHVVRTVARRAERWVVQLVDQLGADDVPLPAPTVAYLNRLSDYAFTLSRWLGKQLNAPEIPWISKT
jgi:cob(I)alamin adenosyltransferase